MLMNNYVDVVADLFVLETFAHFTTGGSYRPHIGVRPALLLCEAIAVRLGHANTVHVAVFKPSAEFHGKEAAVNGVVCYNRSLRINKRYLSSTC